MNNNDEVNKYVDQLIDQRGFPDLTPEVREELRKDLLARLDEFIMAKVVSSLTDEQVASFESMLKEGKTGEEVQAFISSNVPDFTNFLTNAMLEFKNVYLGIVSAPSDQNSAEKVSE